MFTVKIISNGTVFYLRGATWTMMSECKDTFETKEEAEQALEVAAVFIEKSLVKTARIVRI